MVPLNLRFTFVKINKDNKQKKQLKYLRLVFVCSYRNLISFRLIPGEASRSFTHKRHYLNTIKY